MKTKMKNSLMLAGGFATAAVAGGTVEAHADTVTVQKGNTTWGFAQSHGTTVDQIVKDNNLSNGGSLIYVGQTLQINQVDENADTQQTYQQPVQQDVDATQDQQQDTTQQQQTTPTVDTAQTQQVVAQQQSQPTQTTTYQAPAQTQTTTTQSSNSYTSNVSGDEAAAKAWIVQRESGGSYTARNGKYIGKYQLDASYLNGDYSPANQDRVADQYVASRYGSWTNAKAHWVANNWY